MAPLSYESLESAYSFSSTQCFEGIVGIKGNELRIIQVERLGEIFT
jgi:splicing factor 3B subunit 3